MHLLRNRETADARLPSPETPMQTFASVDLGSRSDSWYVQWEDGRLSGQKRKLEDSISLP
jgi:hypothetical protein